jgi:hypothetical protein
MTTTEGPQLRLQQQIDCQLEINPITALEAWQKAGWKEEPGTDVDEAPLKYMSLVLLAAIEDRASRLAIDKDAGVTFFADATKTLPKAPEHFIARGLEIIREITGLENAATGRGTLALGIRNDSLEFTIQKDRGVHVINIPPLQ